MPDAKPVYIRKSGGLGSREENAAGIGNLLKHAGFSHAFWHLLLMGVKSGYSLLLFMCMFSVMHVWCGILQLVDFPISCGLFLRVLQGMNGIFLEGKT